MLSTVETHAYLARDACLTNRGQSVPPIGQHAVAKQDNAWQFLACFQHLHESAALSARDNAR